MNKDYTKFTIADMRKELKKRGVAFKRNDRRDDLIARLVESEGPKSVWPTISIILALAILIASLGLFVTKVV